MSSHASRRYSGSIRVSGFCFRRSSLASSGCEPRTKLSCSAGGPPPTRGPAPPPNTCVGGGGPPPRGGGPGGAGGVLLGGPFFRGGARGGLYMQPNTIDE